MYPSPLTAWLGDPDFEAFAAAIAATPDDDAPRLVLADWLEARGDERTARKELRAAGKPVLNSLG
jgi:uncharacterized protein (TIGR02996 family)